MMAIDLGPVMVFLFVVLIVIPISLGLFLGMGVGYMLTRKKSTSKTKKVFIILTCGIILAVLFPIVAIKFSQWQTDYENVKFNILKKQYLEQSLRNFRIEKVSTSKNAYQIVLSVPRTGKYRMVVNLFQNNKQTSLLPKWVDGVDLVEGINTLNLDVQNKSIISLPADFVIIIQNSDDTFALRNTRKSVYIFNAGEIEKLEGVIYYSPFVKVEGKQCPVFNYHDWLACVPNSLLHIE